jgi:hypothetical protein
MKLEQKYKNTKLKECVYYLCGTLGSTSCFTELTYAF